MRRGTKRILGGLIATVLLASACSDDSETDAAPTSTAVDATEVSAPADETTTTSEAESADTTDTTGADPAGDADTTTTSEADDTDDTADDGEAANADEVAELCDAYLDSISFGTIDEGLAALDEILGDDAPIGIVAALETLLEPEGDIEAFFRAQNTIDGYVLPICNERFTASIVPAADNATAAELFETAVRDGDQAAAERIAPTNVIAAFSWGGFPDTTSQYDADNDTMSMLLEPTVTVFCQLSGGAIEFCAFGE